MTCRHPIPPLYSSQSRILILGSFPSVKSREGLFFYHHPQNRFWRVLAAVYGCAVPETVEEKRQMILSHGAALWDVIASCEIAGSSDASIRDVTPTDLAPIFRSAPIRRVYCNGAAAGRLYRKYQLPLTGIPAVQLPSTSPANAAWSLQRLIAAWSVIQED